MAIPIHLARSTRGDVDGGTILRQLPFGFFLIQWSVFGSPVALSRIITAFLVRDLAAEVVDGQRNPASIQLPGTTTRSAQHLC
jgi:hypothetical protein